MYINKVDDLIDRIIDDFYATVILQDKKIVKIKEELNFIKSQKEINELILNYIKTIPSSEITDIVKKGDSYTTIFDTIRRYIVIYVFLTIGVTYKGKADVFINNLIEFTRNQAEYSLKIDSFFNSESNSLIIKLFYMCKNILLLLSKDAVKGEYIRKEPYSVETMDFIGNLSDEFIDAAFRLKSLNNDVVAQTHNIIKTIVVLLVYKIMDKKNLYVMIEQTELSEGEYMFIDIIEPISESLNFNTIESLLSKRDLFMGLAYDIWDYMEDIENKNKQFITNEEKINILINSGIIVPILDDFLLYHRDTEKYDKSTISGAVKKKEDTKVRYIIGKIDTSTELYTEATKKDPKLRANIMKNFTVPLYDRKAILRNNNEEINIINKFINQGKRNIENNEYFNDLVAYRRYTYINFKDFDKNGFSNHFTKTVTAVRAVNFDTTSEFKQNNIHQRLQLRVGPKDSVGNIVGFMIPSNTKHIQCIKTSEVINIRDLSKKNKNGFDLFLQFLKRSVIKGEEHKSSVYWLFDPELDRVKIDQIEAKENTSQQDIVRSIVAEFYNKVVTDIYYEMIDRMDIQKNVTLNEATKIIEYLESTILKMPLSREMYEDIEKFIFERKMVNLESGEILENDTLYGLEGDTLQLPEYIPPKGKNVKKITIDLANISESGEIIEADTINGVCQHNITWDNIDAIRKTDYSEYMRQLYNFIQQYVVENTHSEFICKSCGFYLDIRKYIQDGVFTDDKGFVTFSMPMETNLEDIPEYEKFKFSIKIMDKNIEKIASSVGIPYFIGNSTTVKWRRKAIIKNTIDMVTQNNQMLSKTFKERNELKTKLYGVSKGISNLFVFEMENSIFQTSSKDKDLEQFKMIKRNNIITYIMIYIIFELNESQISFFLSDKKNLCDIRIFDRIYTTFFGGLRIKKNNTNDTVDISKYKILCYLIYMISCRIAKHRLWTSPQTTEKNIQKMIPNIQRYIVHTCVDIINSILENSFQTGVSYIFEVFRVRFYSKLNTIFQDDDYYAILLEQNKLSFASARKRAHLKVISQENMPPFIYNDSRWRVEIPVRYFISYAERTKTDLHNLSNLTNCPDGKFHKWKFEEDRLQCTLCKSNMRDLKFSKEDTTKILENYEIERSNLLARKFCLADGELHQYIYDRASGKNICIKCKKPDDHNYSANEISQIDKMIKENGENRRNKYTETNNEYIATDDAERKYIDSVLENNLSNMKAEYDKEHPFKYIDNFVDLMLGSIGNEIKGEYPIQLRNNTYIIDHDHNGLSLSGQPLVITEADNKIFHKANHPHFKTDVIYYTNKATTRNDVFYDAVTHVLLGYKESSKEFVDIKKSNKKIKINYSIYNKIKLLGYAGEYINIDTERAKKLSLKETLENEKSKSAVEANTDLLNTNRSNEDIASKQDIFKEIVKDISRVRIDNLRRTIMEFQRLFNRIVNGFTDRMEEKTHDVEFTNKNYEQKKTYLFSERMNTLVDKYKNKLRDINMSGTNGKHKVFKHWKAITRGIHVDNFDDKYFNFDSDLIESDNISRYDDQSNKLLYYLIHEFTSLLKYNQDGFMKSNVCNFLVEFIDRIFFRYNTEYLRVNNDINRFMYILSSVGFLKETEDQTQTETTQGIYEEYVDMEGEPAEEDLEALIDDEEEKEAMDLDMDAADLEEGVASAYDHQVDIESGFEASDMAMIEGY